MYNSTSMFVLVRSKHFVFRRLYCSFQLQFYCCLLLPWDKYLPDFSRSEPIRMADWQHSHATFTTLKFYIQEEMKNFRDFLRFFLFSKKRRGSYTCIIMESAAIDFHESCRFIFQYHIFVHFELFKFLIVSGSVTSYRKMIYWKMQLHYST